MIRENVKALMKELPHGVTLVGAAKTRTPDEILEAVEAGLAVVGENYVQEAESAFAAVGHRVKWHLIGHLQSNKAKKAVKIFDMIETVDSEKLAQAIDRACKNEGKVMPVLVEVNSGEEDQKAGVMPEDCIDLIRNIARLEHIRVVGLMTMGPFSDNPEEVRPAFRKTRKLFEEIRKMNIPCVEMIHLSMGMSGSYKAALEEGATMVRIGTNLFGERKR